MVDLLATQAGTALGQALRPEPLPPTGGPAEAPPNSDPGFISLVDAYNRAQAPRSGPPVTGGKIQTLRNGGFSEDAITTWAVQKRNALTAAGFTPEAITEYLTGNKTPPKEAPKAFMDRFLESPGMRVLKGIGKGAQIGWGQGPLGIDPGGEVDKFIQGTGFSLNVGGKNLNPVRIFGDSVIYPAAQLGDALMRSIATGIGMAGYGGAAAIVEATADKPGSPEAQQEAMKGGAELTEAANIAMLLTMAEPSWSRMKQDPVSGKLFDETFTGLPTADDVGNTTRALGGPTAPASVQDKLLRVYEEKGIHPAEVFSDVNGDITIKQKLLSSTDEIPYKIDWGPARKLMDQADFALGGEASRAVNEFIGLPPAAKESGESSGIMRAQRMEAIARGEAPEAAAELEAVFHPVREGLRQQYGNTIRLYRVQTAIPDAEPTVIRGSAPADGQRAALSWTADKAFADYYAGIQKNKPPIPEQTIVDLEEKFANSGEVKIPGTPYTLKQEDGGVSIYDPAVGGFVTDTESVRTFVNDINKQRAELAGENADKAKLIVTADVPLDDVLWASDRAAQTEFIVRNKPESDFFIDDKGIVGPAKIEAAATGEGGQPPKPPAEGEIIPPAGGEPPPKIEGPEVIEGSTEANLAAAREKIREKISVGAPTPGKQRGPMGWLSYIYENLGDSLFGLQQTEKRLSSTGQLAEEVSESPTKLARLFAGVAEKAQDMLENGPRDFATLKPVGRGLRSILDDVIGVKEDLGPLSAYGDWTVGASAGAKRKALNEFRDFIVSARALELENRGIKSGFDAEAARKIVEAATPKQKAALIELQHFQDGILKYLRDSGVLSREGYAAIKEGNQLYVPFYRLFEDPGDFKSPGKSYIPYNPVFRIKGSEREVVDPLESIIRNTFAFVNLADRNVITTKLLDKLLAAEEAIGVGPIKKVVVDTTDARADIKGFIGHNGGPPISDEVAQQWQDVANFDAKALVSVFRNGRKESYHIDPELAKSLKGLNADSVNFIVRMLNIPASTLRAGAVLTPQFALKFLMRDFVSAMATYDGVFTPLDTAKGLLGMIVKDKDFSDWLASGGGGGFTSFDRRYLQENLDKLGEQTGLTTRAWNVILDPESTMARKLKIGLNYGLGFSAANKYIVNPLRFMTEVVLSANRLAAFKKTLRKAEKSAGTQAVSKETMLQAGFTSRETSVDPARIGASMRAFNMISAFANATIADPIRMVRALKDKPIQSTLIALGAVTGPSVLLWAWNRGDSRIAELPDWRKDMFWNFGLSNWEEVQAAQAQGRPSDQVRIVDGKYYVNNGPVLSYPKPWGWGLVFGTIPERILDAYYAENPSGLSSFFDSMRSSLAPSLTPTAVTPFYEQWANKSLFTGQTLIPSYLEGQLPEYEYVPYTTEITKRIGSIVAAFPGMRDTAIGDSPLAGLAHALTSPVIMENYIQAWTGTLGDTVLQLADYALRKSGNLPDPVRPTATLADIPFIKAFVVRYPSASAESIQRFYSENDRVNTYFTTWQSRLAAGDVEGEEKIRLAGGDKMFVQLNGIRQALGTQSSVVRMINDNPDIPAEEKRQLIDSIYFGMIQIAQTANAAMEQIK